MQRYILNRCQVANETMKTIFICSVFLLTFLSCEKNSDNNCLREFSMTIEYAVTPGNSVPNSSFDVRFGVVGANLCYKLLHTDLIAKPNNVFEIRPIGTIPCKEQICAQAIYRVADTITIPTTAPGTYRVDYYSNNSLLASSNVIVN